MAKQKYLYNNYIKTLSERVEAALSSIQIGSNLEYGIEFEIVLCEILRSILPTKYGICRGYIVDKDGNQAGDDIIIYEQVRFPTFGLRDKENFIRKEFIPIEAVYCYIEAKHTINLLGNDSQSLNKSISQVAKVKQVCSSRKAVPTSMVTPYHNLTGLNVTTPEYYPQFQNPLFSVIIANQVRDKKNGELLNAEQILNRCGQDGISITGARQDLPDLIVLGKDVAILPVLPRKDKLGQAYLSPFFLPQYSVYRCAQAEKIAFGIALNSITWALDWILLGEIPWKDIITNTLGIPYRDFD